MLLKGAHVTLFKSIEDSSDVSVDDAITVLVGQNESGKTAFLQALSKTRSVEDDAEYNYVEEYPRRLLRHYESQHGTSPAVVAHLRYELETEDIDRINRFAGFELLDALSLTLTYKYNNGSIVTIDVPEEPYVQHRVCSAGLTTEVRKEVEPCSTIGELINTLDELDLNDQEQTFLDDLKQTFVGAERWSSPFEHYIYTKLVSPYVPKFLYFDDYYLLPGKINLPDLQSRIQTNNLRDEDKTARSLLRLAGVDLSSLTASAGYESIRAKLEGISISITDKIFEFWTQNQQLAVEFDIRSDPTDEPPFDEGDNLYIRIRNQRHRVTVPFSQRSKGFIWFFSFITWFDSIQQEVGTKSNLVLLLDEPGLE